MGVESHKREEPNVQRDEESLSRDETAAAKLVEAGSEIAGGSVAAGVGLVVGALVGGPPGAIAGAAMGPLAIRAVRHTVGEIAMRQLTHREQVRVGGVVALAAARLEQRVASGEAIRGDDFFKPDRTGRAPGEEVIEGVLLVAQREYEERKSRTTVAREVLSELFDLYNQGLLGPHGLATSMSPEQLPQQMRLTQAGDRLVEVAETSLIDLGDLVYSANDLGWRAKPGEPVEGSGQS